MGSPVLVLVGGGILRPPRTSRLAVGCTSESRGKACNSDVLVQENRVAVRIHGD